MRWEPQIDHFIIIIAIILTVNFLVDTTDLYMTNKQPA